MDIPKFEENPDRTEKLPVLDREILCDRSEFSTMAKKCGSRREHLGIRSRNGRIRLKLLNRSCQKGVGYIVEPLWCYK